MFFENNLLIWHFILIRNKNKMKITKNAGQQQRIMIRKL